ncbi:MAG: hypothetical protein HFJ91_03330 [Muribaculaceae bacterium]|nr:hypothetical protein [Muribaculaceae bacterium]
MKTIHFILLLLVVTLWSACDSVDDNRIPYCEVRLTFPTVGDWNLYGVKGDAASYERYILAPGMRVPSAFPYTAMDRTGYGGLLLVADVLGDLHAYDLACPYEARPEIRLFIPEGELYAECPVCGSTYEVFSNGGMPRSGPAADRGYALQRYSVTSGGALNYKIITR